ncbi:MAG: RNase adapter RapZ [Bdellovibrionales bacterium]|nr:RNase adapter RapZ [Bdellovibrionales bacterium]
MNVGHIEHLVFVVGLSGAGKSTASRALSDAGFFAIDNLPVALLENFLLHSQDSVERYRKTSILLDIDSADQRAQFLRMLDQFGNESSNIHVMFLDCTTEQIIRRYSETRRPHPCFEQALDNTLAESIQRERSRLLPLKELAHFVLDTSDLNVHQLRRKIHEAIDSFVTEGNRSIRVNFVSFGFKFGAPPDLDLLVDVRFIPNPYFVAGLRKKTGKDQEVSQYVLAQPQSLEFLEKYGALLAFLIPQYAFEGKAYLRIGVGCTGGRHRSVTIAEALASRIAATEAVVSVLHRDIEK